ncbi:MAG: ABC transporter ATP-binding protein [Lachnospiraceae bacterium]|nr:ABC transporter ATP-binding protein [Lachnospiraceae bacterium]
MAQPKDEKKEAYFASAHKLRMAIRDGTFHEILDDWKWIFSYSKKYKGAIAVYTLFGILSSTMGIAASIASKYAIDVITGYQTEKLWLLIAITVGTAFCSLFFSSLVNRISTKFSLDIHNDIQADIFDRIIDVDWKAIREYSSGDILNRFNSDVGTVSSNAISWLPTVLISVFNFMITFAVIWHYNKPMSLLAFASAPIMLLMSKYLIRRQREHQRKVREISSKMMAFEVETFYNFDTIKSFGITKRYGAKLREWQAKLKKQSLDYNLFSIRTNVFMSVLGLIVQYLAFGYCLYLLWTHQITYGTMTLFLEQRGRLSRSFNQVVGIVPSFLSSSVSAHRIRELIELPREVHLKESEDLSAFADLGVEVRMDDVSFAYEEGEKVIADTSFVASPGEIVALVGPSGEGKTTMIRLMLGLIHPDMGEAKLRIVSGPETFEKLKDSALFSENGDYTLEVDVNADSRYLFSYVPQGNTVISGTIAENLRMVKEDATDEEIEEALRTACAWDFVSKLPDGINSTVGERGRGLSEGQAQRIAIARAVLRDAPILLLDEATSALDVQTERDVLHNIVRRRPNRTCIITTHRPSVLSMCQRVYRVMEKTVTETSEEENERMMIDF